MDALVKGVKRRFVIEYVEDIEDILSLCRLIFLYYYNDYGHYYLF